MTIEPILFFDLLIAVVVLAISLIVVVVANVKLNKGREGALIHEGNLEGRQSAILADAANRASHMVQDAQVKAQQILASAQLFTSQTRQSFDEQLKALALHQEQALSASAMDLLASYKKTIEQLEQENNILFQNVSKDIEQVAVSEIKDFTGVLREETVELQKLVGQKIEEEYAVLKKELDVMRQERIKRMEEQIYDVVADVARDILGKNLTLSDQEDIVVRALEKAKQNGQLKE